MKVTKKIDWEKTVPVIKYGAAFASGLVSGLDKIGQGLDASNSLGGILRNINPIAKMGGKTGFVIQNTSSVFYKAGTLFNKIGQKVAPVAKVLTSKTFQAVGFVAGVADDIANQGKTFGQAVAHNGAGLAVGATALALTPVGWGVVGAAAVGVVAGFAFDAAYNSNFLGIRDGLDWVGSKIDKGLNKLFNPPRRSIILV
ncbi:TPA: hypothetical protein U1C34_001025 [Streptococcus suis]|nr:hypothetical protein [Streptococcus suis]HEM3667069.1 hypothetical protein [Streptococcus suis]HEM3715249.1 hypothetical protein [Streptococcus suis]HEM3721690.1 hypothetical protein [Streptococcus suis]